MNLDMIVIELGGRPILLGEVILAAAVIALFLLLVTAVLAWRGQRVRGSETMEAIKRASELEFRLAEMAGQLRNFTDQAASSQAQLARTLDERLDHVSHRLGRGMHEQAERTHQSLNHLYERLAVIDSAQANLTQLSSEMLSLKDILANKQARGAFGQARMEAIVRDGLHANAYSFQSTLSNGTRPDCLIKLPDSELRLVIDAKFPLEAFNALKSASGEQETRGCETRLRKDVLHHVKDIAQKYLIAGETHETAIMFVPSESIYADLYERFEDVIQKAHRERVIIASPNILMLLIQTMQAIFKDARMREQAGLIKVEVVRLLEDVGRLKDRVLDLQRHFGQASGDLEKLALSADKVTKRGMRIEQLELQDPAAVTSEDAAQLRLVQKG